MESQHMTQQVFADYLGMAPATLSGIFNDRTRPSLNVVEAIKKKFPNISTDWLVFGKDPMYLSEGGGDAPTAGDTTVQSGLTAGQQGYPTGQGYAKIQSNGMSPQEAMLDFGSVSSPTPQVGGQMPSHLNGVRLTRPELLREEMKFVDKPQRRVTEIRVYYDDQTWESFVPSKK